MPDAAMLEAAQTLLVFSSGPFYFVEKIVGHRVVYCGSPTFEVLVKWEGYAQQTWEPLSGLKEHQAVQDYVDYVSKLPKNSRK